MKLISIIPAAILIALFSSSCSHEVSSREFADRFIAAENKAWATGKTDDLKTLEDDDVIYHLPGLDVSGWKAHEDYILNGRSGASDLKQDWKYLSGEGNHVVLAYKSSAVLKGDDKTPPQATSNDYLFVLRLKNQKVVEVWANGSGTSKPVTP